MIKKKIAFVTGGYSGEAEVSYNSAKTISANVDRELFDVYTIDIRKDGWWHVSENGSLSPVDKNDFSIVSGGEKINFDAVLIGIHGTPGEDGKLQGYFDMIGIPYTTCDASVSALTFNKRFTVAVAAFSGIAVSRSLHFYKGEVIDVQDIASRLNFPLFVKPANGGSSIGMSKVPDIAGLPAALEKAFREDTQVLVEEFIEGREFTVGVCRLKDEVITLPLTEVISENYFFDYEAKYHGKSKEITPAELEENKAELIRDTAKKIYRTFNCRGVIRIDFIFNEADGKPYMLEINTVPGQSAASVVPQQVRALGWNLKDFYTGLIEAALSGH
ncbi:MAG: D-alanine--D-alanine ligase [Chitinophagaceae bacterium]|nr:D-alanine--D-alanine ligase [Chitinophagaceae bacterium]